MAQIGDLLEQRRLVTLVGPGGCGKTRLAVEAAAARVRHHADGVWLVGLADVSPSDAPSTEGVAAAVAAALGIQEEQARLLSDTVRDRLRGTEMLLVLDNCEHVLREAALFAQQVLEAGRSVRVMATGREPLGLVGEAVYVVDPLPVPDDDALSFDAEAVQLFLDRATLARPGFEPTDDDLRRIGHVCRRLDGIPLALELAAARLRALTVSQLEARLDSRFRLLVGTAAHVPRHRTLQATLDWSYDLLTVEERDAAFRLSVFAGGFDLEAASRVIDAPELETLDTLARLVDRSLLTMHDVAGSRRATACSRPCGSTATTHSARPASSSTPRGAIAPGPSTSRRGPNRTTWTRRAPHGTTGWSSSCPTCDWRCRRRWPTRRPTPSAWPATSACTPGCGDTWPKAGAGASGPSRPIPTPSRAASPAPCSPSASWPSPSSTGPPARPHWRPAPSWRDRPATSQPWAGPRSSSLRRTRWRATPPAPWRPSTRHCASRTRWRRPACGPAPTSGPGR